MALLLTIDFYQTQSDGWDTTPFSLQGVSLGKMLGRSSGCWTVNVGGHQAFLSGQVAKPHQPHMRVVPLTWGTLNSTSAHAAVASKHDAAIRAACTFAPLSQI